MARTYRARMGGLLHAVQHGGIIMSITDTRPRVYLAGPILGCTQGEATDWRKFVATKLLEHNIVGVSPLRCEPIHGERYSADYPDERFGVPRAIAAKNRFDVLQCTMGVFYVPTPNGAGDAWEDFIKANPDAWTSGNEKAMTPRDVFLNGWHARRLHSFGTLGEMFWTNGEGKQTILVTDDEFIAKHPVIDAAANWKFVVPKGAPAERVFQDAIDVLVGVLGAYAPEGKAI